MPFYPYFDFCCYLTAFPCLGDCFQVGGKVSKVNKSQWTSLSPAKNSWHRSAKFKFGHFKDACTKEKWSCTFIDNKSRMFHTGHSVCVCGRNSVSPSLQTWTRGQCAPDAAGRSQTDSCSESPTASGTRSVCGARRAGTRSGTPAFCGTANFTASGTMRSECSLFSSLFPRGHEYCFRKCQRQPEAGAAGE